MAKNRLAKLTKSTVTEASPVMHRPSAQEQAERRRYQAEDALRTITRAEEIKRNRPLMADVKKCAREQAKTLDCVLGKRK